MKHPLDSALRLALVAAACAPGLRAQDSVSKLSALPGDALDAYSNAEQINDYVVDQTSFTSSWGKTFGIAPIAKGSDQRNSLPLFFTSQFSAQTLSRRVASNAPFLRNSYMLVERAGVRRQQQPDAQRSGHARGHERADGIPVRIRLRRVQ